MRATCPRCGECFETSTKPGYHGRLSKYVTDIVKMHEAGRSTADIAEKIRRLDCRSSSVPITASYIAYILRRLGLVPIFKVNLANTSERNAQIVELHNSGMKRGKIAEKYGISGGRVWQIITIARRKSLRRTTPQPRG